MNSALSERHGNFYLAYDPLSDNQDMDRAVCFGRNEHPSLSHRPGSNQFTTAEIISAAKGDGTDGYPLGINHLRNVALSGDMEEFDRLMASNDSYARELIADEAINRRVYDILEETLKQRNQAIRTAHTTDSGYRQADKVTL